MQKGQIMCPSGCIMPPRDASTSGLRPPVYGIPLGHNATLGAHNLSFCWHNFHYPSEGGAVIPHCPSGWGLIISHYCFSESDYGAKFAQRQKSSSVRVRVGPLARPIVRGTIVAKSRWLPATALSWESRAQSAQEKQRHTGMLCWCLFANHSQFLPDA